MSFVSVTSCHKVLVDYAAVKGFLWSGSGNQNIQLPVLLPGKRCLPVCGQGAGIAGR